MKRETYAVRINRELLFNAQKHVGGSGKAIKYLARALYGKRGCRQSFVGHQP